MSQFLYALLTAPSVVVSFLNDPLYKIILNETTDAAEYDFTNGKKTKSPKKIIKIKFLVSYGMAAVSGASILLVIYMFFDIQKIVKKKEYEWESAGSPKIERKITLQEKMQKVL